MTADLIDGSSSPCTDLAKMASWSGSVAAAEAKMLKIPACPRSSLQDHPYGLVDSLVSIVCRLVRRSVPNDIQRLSVSSKLFNNGLSKHGDVLKTYTSFGISIEKAKRVVCL